MGPPRSAAGTKGVAAVRRGGEAINKQRYIVGNIGCISGQPIDSVVHSVVAGNGTR